MKGSKNPLFVVSNKGMDVEEATGLFDALVKRFGLGPWVELLNSYIETFLMMASNYGAFVALKKYIDQVVDLIEELIKKVDPFLAFQLFYRP